MFTRTAFFAVGVPGPTIIGRSGTRRGNRCVRKIGDRLQGEGTAGTNALEVCGSDDPKSQRASHPGSQVWTEQSRRLIENAHDPLGGQVAAPHGTFHCGRPTGIGPVARQEKPVDRRALSRPKRLHTWAYRERRPVLRHDPRTQKRRRAATKARSRPARPAPRRESRAYRARGGRTTH